MFSRLEDRIRELCAKAVDSRDSAESIKALRELRLALHEHTECLRARLLFPMPPERRRKSSHKSAA